MIAEGATDQVVLENILCGYFDTGEDPVVNRVRPPPTAKGIDPAPGGWTLVFRSLRAGEHRKALQVNNYVLIHIDTDVCEEPGFDVSRRAADGRPLRPDELIEQVKLKLIAAMDPEFCERNAARIVFAIAVDSIECWLLPLLYDGEVAKKAKTTGGLDAANRKLQRLNQPLLSRGDNKILASYESASREYSKRKKLMRHRDENPSLDVFVTNLDALDPSTLENGEDGFESDQPAADGLPEP